MASGTASRGSTIHMATTTLKVEGMTCGACTSSVESAFHGVDGVGSVSVSLVMERAVIRHDPKKVSADQIKEMIEDRGFDAQVLATDLPLPSVERFEDAIESDDEVQSPIGTFATTTLSVKGMTCGACTAAVEGAFKGSAGVKSLSVSLLAERAVVEHDTTLISPGKIAETIEDAGFDAEVISTSTSDSKSRHPRRRRSSKKSQTVTTTVAIGGMTCGACTSAVENGFKGTDGLVKFNISLLAERAVLIHDPARLPIKKVLEIVEDCGFDAHLVSSLDTDATLSTSSTSVTLKIFGLVDEGAARELQAILQRISGIENFDVDMLTARALVTYDPQTIGLRAIVEAVERTGYNALLAESEDNNAQLESLAKTKEIQEWRRAFRISVSFAIPVFLTSMIFPMFIHPLDYGSIQLPLIPGLWLGDVVCLLLTIPVQFGIGRRFYKSAFRSLRHGAPTMDVLVILGTSAAFFFSIGAMCVSIFTEPHSRPATVFDTSTMLITFITLGRLLESSAKSHTSRALSRLMSLAPSMASIYADPIVAEKLAESMNLTGESVEKVAGQSRSLGEERTVPTELIQVGDVVILRPGDKVPADGTVMFGESYVDESMVTGEAMPIFKKPGSPLMAGTVNGAARVDFKVTRAGRDTQLSHIVRLVQEAQTNRAPIQRMADRVAGYFVPTIILLGVITFVGWMVLSHVLPSPPSIFLDHASGGSVMVCLKLCISVIVFACPCALGLSTPTAVMVGTGVGAEQGILVKGGLALETATRITHIVFDKTGTLTFGKMSVSRSSIEMPEVKDPYYRQVWWTAVGLAEMGSEHPIGKAIVRSAREALDLGTDGAFDGSVDQFKVSVGRGIMATVRVTQSIEKPVVDVMIGNSSFLRAHNIKLPRSHSNSSTGSSTESLTTVDAGATKIHIAFDSKYAGFVTLSDAVKPSAAAAISALRRMGITSSIVTGDALPAARAVAKLVDIPESNVYASVTPNEKQALIQRLKASGPKQVIAMVGDGINDSPALATADIGISLSSGTDVAMEAADVVLMRPDDLLDVAAALHLSRTVFSRIKLNLWWACGYNIFGLPFAMGFFLPWGLSLHPMAAGAAMAASSVSVVVSSLCLRFWKRPRWMNVASLQPGAADSQPRLRRRLSYRFQKVLATLGLRSGRDEVAYVPLSTVDAV